MTPQEVEVARDCVVQAAVLSADAVAFAEHPTEATRTRAIVERVIDFAIGNGLIELTDPSTWPEWLVLDPPFTGD